MTAIPADVFRKGLRCALLTSCAFAVAPVMAQDTNIGIADIIVTAQKREQNLQDVPIAVSAFTTETLEANRIQDVNGLSAITPNLTVRPVGGGSLAPNYSMRGVVTGGTAAGTDKGVSLYIDGAYIQNVQGSVFELADIQRIEVLKGPQGTLFGRNATGGAVSIITADPTGEFGIRQQLTYGNYDQFRAKTHVDLPSWGPLSLAFNYLHSERRGDIRNLGAGTKWNAGPASGGKLGVLTAPKYMGSSNVDAVLVAAKIDLGDFKVVYKFDYTDNNYTPEGAGIAYLGSSFAPLLALSPNQLTPVTALRPKAVNNWFSSPNNAKSRGHNLTATYRLSDNISLKDILSVRRSELEYGIMQLDGLGGLTAANKTTPLLYFINSPSQRDKQWSNEFQVNVNTHLFDLTLGYIHFENRGSNSTVTGINGNSTPVIGTNPNGTPIFSSRPFPVIGQGTSSFGTNYVIWSAPTFSPSLVHARSDALYAQPEVHLTDQLTVVAGIRWTSDRKDGTEPNPATGAATPIKYRDNRFTYLAGINFKPTEDILTYVKYATGYISGGQLATIPFEAETAKSWEGGIKADLFDRRLRSNLSVFAVSYKAMQVTTSGALTGIPSSATFGQAVVSGFDAKAKGFEWENTIVPVSGVTLTANVGYTDFHYVAGTIFPGFVATSGLPGYQVSARPKWTGSLSAQYEIPDAVAGGKLSFRADGNFRSKVLNTTNISTSGGQAIPTAPLDPVLVKAATTPFQWVVNARAALSGVDIGGLSTDFAFWGKNIFNNRHITQLVGPVGPVGAVLYERAPTYGVDVSFKF